MGRVAPENPPNKHWSEQKPQALWAKSFQAGRQPTPVAPTQEEQKEEEDDDEEEYAHVPLWRRALMKKRAEEERVRKEQEKRIVSAQCL